MSWTSTGLARNETLQQLTATVGADGTTLGTGGASLKIDVLTSPLKANDYWQGEPLDIIGTDHGANAAYIAFAATLMTDVANSYLFIDTSSDAITWTHSAIVQATPVVSTTTGGSISSGTTIVPVVNPIGFTAGDYVIIGSGAQAETVTIAPGGVGTATITLTAATSKSHASTAVVEGLYVAAAEYQVRGFRYARCAGTNGPVDATITKVSAQTKGAA